MVSVLFSVFLAAFLFLGTAPAGAAQAPDRFPIRMQIENEGKPTAKVGVFEVNESAIDFLAVGGSAINVSLDRFSGNMSASEVSALREAAALELWDWVGQSANVVGMAGTFAEHGMLYGGLSKANNAMTNIGAVLTAIQVGINLYKGETKEAAVNAFKGTLNFAIGKYGTSAMQLSSIALVAIDYSLNKFGTTAWAEREKAWRHVYRRYYAVREAGQRGTVTQQKTLAERFRAIRSRREAGRSVNDWKVVAAFYHQNAKTPEQFERWVNADIGDYVGKFWDSAQFSEYSADGNWSTAGFARSTSLTETIKTNLQREHADTIRKMLVKRVFPDLQRMIIRKTLERLVADLNETVMPELNAPVLIDVSAYDLDAPAKFVMPLPKGGQWAGTLQPGQTRQLKLTRLAYLLAGFPDTIRLEGPDGPAEKKFTVENDMATVVFGTPPVSTISVMDRTESDLSCTLTTTDRNEQVTVRTETRPAPAPTPLHFSAAPDGNAILGHFDGTAWSLASPGRFGDAGMSLGAPYFENIVAIDGCSLARKDHDFYGTFADNQCTFTRRLIEPTGDGGTTEISCTSQVTMKLTGGFTMFNGAMVFVPMDEDFFGDLQREYEKAQDAMDGLGIMQGLPQ